MIYENLTDDECALYVLAMDESGLDLAEFCYIDEQKDEHGFSDGCFRAWPFQYGWWRLKDQKTISAGSRSCGKALAITTPILTTDGWKTMESISIGDTVFDESGARTKVTHVFDVMDDRECFEITFDDGSVIIADGDHEWPINIAGSTLNVTTNQLLNNNEYKIDIKVSGNFPDVDLIREPTGSQRTIKSVIRVPSVPVRCISVDSKNHLYLAGRNLIPTHNSMSIRFRAFAFPFLNPGEEMVITAPEANHLDAVTGNIETLYTNCKLASEMLIGGRSGIKHRPFLMNFTNGARIMGRIPQLDGSGVKGCLVEGEFILTKDGYKKAEELSTDDYVMNHHNKWAKVSYIYEDVNDCYEVNGIAGFPIKVSCDHRFYGAVNTSGPKQKRNFGPMIFCDVRNMVEDNFYWASPTRIPYVEPKSEGLIDFFDKKEFWWLVGRYLADGFLSMDKTNNKARKVNICITPKQQIELTKRLDILGLNYWVKARDYSSADILSIGNASIHNWLKMEFRELSHKKRIPAFVYTLNPILRENLLFGYLSGDGSYDEKRDRYTAGTASKELALGLQLLGQSLGMNTGASVSQPTVTEIMGVKLKNKPKLSYRVTFNSNGLGFLKDGYLLNKVQSVTPIGKRKVFNPVIEDGHSYLSGTVMSHNIHPIWLEHDEACFPGETLILTDSGHKRIDQVNVGDKVLTHKNRWKKVLNVWDRGEKETITVNGQGNQNLTVTPNHRFYAKNILKFKDKKNKWGIQETSDINWVRAEDLGESLWSSPVRFEGAATMPSGIPKSKTGISKPIDVLSKDFLWCLGLYIAEGSTSSSYGKNGKLNKSTWSIHVKEVPEVLARMKAAGLKPLVQPVQNTSNCSNVVVSSVGLAPWLSENCGKGCYNKKIPAWVFSLDDASKHEVLDGLIYGDGCDSNDLRYESGRRRLSTTSKALAYDAKLLAQTLGFYSNVYYYKGGGTCVIQGKEYTNADSYEVIIANNGQGYYEDDLILTRVKSIDFHGGIRRVYDIEVEDDHSFVAEGIVVHNSDYPAAGWTELVSTVKFNTPRGRWRAHGVTRGVGDDFDDKISGKDPTWQVTSLPAMYRPDWTEQERQDKITTFGGYDSDGYRRNVKGTPGDGNSPMFVLHRIMANVTIDLQDSFNAIEYYSASISEAQVREVDDITDLIEVPAVQIDKYKNFWIGMDFGWSIAPSAIVVFAEEKHPKKDETSMKLLTKILLSKITPEDQLKVIMNLMDTYRPISYAMDATGAGEPVIALFKKKIAESSEDAWMIDRIKNFNFSSKIIVGFDDKVKINELDPSGWEAAAIKRPFLEASADAMRILIDSTRMPLPYDKEVIGELQSTPKNNRVALDAYGKTTSRKAGQHVLDAIRMAVLAQHTKHIDEFIESHKQNWTPPPMFFG